MAIFEDENIILSIENSWSNDFSLGVVGWIIGKKHPVEEFVIAAGENKTKVTTWFSRKDIADQFPEYPVRDKCGFSVQLYRLAEHPLSVEIVTSESRHQKKIYLSGNRPKAPEGVLSENIFMLFTDLVNKNKWRVLEMGARKSPLGFGKKEYMQGARDYVGFDFYAGANVDVVGDAHRLSSYFGKEEFDAIFSNAVMEHMAMPWKVVIEINKILKPGGFTFHSAPSAWPLHEIPWDFWRFSTSSFKVLFSRPFGFAIEKMGYYAPMRMYFDDLQPGYEQFPFSVGFGNLSVLAKKIGGVDSKIRWEIELKDILSGDEVYPKTW